MHVQSCCFANINLLPLCRSHFRRLRRCSSSLLPNKLQLTDGKLQLTNISHFVTTARKLSCCSLALDLCRPLSRWASLGCHPLSLFHCISLALFSKFLDMTTNLSLILYKTRIQEKFPLSVFVLIDSLVVSASQDAGGYAISRQNNLELHLGCHTCWMSYFTLVCLWCGRSVYGHVITKFSSMGSLPHFLTYSAPLRAPRARELRYKWMVEKVFSWADKSQLSFESRHHRSAKTC